MLTLTCSRRTSIASTRPRASLSSGDERSFPAHQQTIDAIPQGSSVTTSHSAASSSNTAHRRQTVSRLAGNPLKPIISQDALPPKRHGASTILDIDESTSPTTMAHISPVGNGLDLHQSYPRARRKSLPHESSVLPRAEPHDDSQLNGTLYSKGKKKRSRAASFSLPFHRRRRLSNASNWRLWDRKLSTRLKRWLLALLLVLGLILYAIILWRRKYELQVEFSVFSHLWIRSEIDTTRPLRGCFDSHNVSPDYNISLNFAPKRQLLSPGVSLRRGMSCYDFSSTVQPIPDEPVDPLTYHTYWRSDLIPFGERHTATLTSFLATQPLAYSKLILWSNGAELISTNEFVRPYLEKWGDHIEIRQVDMSAFTRGTELEGLLSSIEGGGLFDERGWVDGDAVRLLVLWHYGGVWLDMDQILTRDLHPLTESEFVTQWDCHGESFLPSLHVESSESVVLRQTLLFAQWRSDAFSTTLSVSMRGFPHHGFVPASQTQHLHLGFPPLRQVAPKTHRRSTKTIRCPTLVFCRSAQLSDRYPIPRSVPSRSGLLGRKALGRERRGWEEWEGVVGGEDGTYMDCAFA